MAVTGNMTISATNVKKALSPNDVKVTQMAEGAFKEMMLVGEDDKPRVYSNLLNILKHWAAEKGMPNVELGYAEDACAHGYMTNNTFAVWFLYGKISGPWAYSIDSRGICQAPARDGDGTMITPKVLLTWKQIATGEMFPSPEKAKPVEKPQVPPIQK